MKKLLAAAGVIMIAYVIGTSAAVGGSPDGNMYEGAGDGDAAYVVRDENNRVVVYRGGELWLRTDTQVSDLPKSDRVKLKKGIAVETEAELNALVEDFCS